MFKVNANWRPIRTIANKKYTNDLDKDVGRSIMIIFNDIATFFDLKIIIMPTQIIKLNDNKIKMSNKILSIIFIKLI